jgi:proline iminopeptidase
MRVKVPGGEIYFDVEGVGLAAEQDRMVPRPTLVALHGGPGGDHSGFKRQLTLLRDVAQIVYVDHRGSGRSRVDDLQTCTLDNNIDDIERLCQHLGLDRITLLGSSYGGMVAQGFAIRYPARVANLVLVVTAPSYRFLEDARRIVESRGTPDQVRVCQRLWDGSFESMDQLHEYYRIMGPMYSTGFDPQKFETGWGRGIRNFEQLNLGFREFLRTFDFTEELSSIACPTLVLAGAHDWICPVEHSRRIAERIPRAHLKVFENSSHMIADDEPDAFLAALRGFLTYASP